MNNKISAGTIARTITLGIALLNQILAVTGHTMLNINNDDVYQLISLMFTICTAGAAWWKNNSFTTAAIKADKWMQREKGR